MALSLVALLVAVGVAYSYYRDFAKMIDLKLAQGPFQTTSKIYAAPLRVSAGDPFTPEQVIAQLKQSGYDQRRNNPLGWYRLAEDAVEVYPGPESYFDMESN